MGLRLRLTLAVTGASTCAATVLGVGFGGVAVPPASAHDRSEARRVAVRFFNALDRGRWSQACSLLARQFYVKHHVPDRRHCVAGFTVGMGGWAVKYRIGHVEATGDKAVVHAVVDGAPGTVQLIREKHRGYRVLELQATES